MQLSWSLPGITDQVFHRFHGLAVENNSFEYSAIKIIELGI